MIIKDNYDSETECKIACPGKCKLNNCMVPNFVFN